MRIRYWSPDVCSADLQRANQCAGHLETHHCFLPYAVPFGLCDRSMSDSTASETARGLAICQSSAGFSGSEDCILAIIFATNLHELGRASCRERVCQYV